MTDLLGLIGFPVEHSRSPAMHRAAIAALGLDAVYVAFAVAPPRLQDAVRGLRALGARGFNATVPHKQAVLALCDEVSDEARAIGAVNTVVVEEGRLVGTNTDAAGLVRAFEEQSVVLEGARVVVLGAGGAARAAVAGLARAGAVQIAVAARRPGAAADLRDGLGRHGVAVQPLPLERRALEAAFADTTLVVQATSATLGDGPAADALADAIPFDALPDDAIVCDLVYEPVETEVLRRAELRGLRTVDGLGMLLHQGALAFERWLGRPAPLEAMRHAIEPRGASVSARRRPR